MKLPVTIMILLAATAASLADAAPDALVLPCKLTMAPEIKKAFHGDDAIEVREITGTATKFQVGGTYRVTGVCRQQTLKNAVIYVGNTAEAGPDAITPVAGSSLYKTLPDGSTTFDCTFTLLRPGILHVTVYDLDGHDESGNAYAGVYLGDVVFKH